MRRYETIVIVDPDLSEEGRAPLFDRIKEVIPQQGGTLIDIEDWGNKRLAYNIKKKPRGFYARLDYCGNGTVVDELERFFRIDDRMMKYLTVVIDEDADPEALLAEKTAAADAQAAAEAAAKAAAEAAAQAATEAAAQAATEAAEATEAAAETPDTDDEEK